VGLTRSVLHVISSFGRMLERRANWCVASLRHFRGAFAMQFIRDRLSAGRVFS